jgi:hypothetical protein
MKSHVLNDNHLNCLQIKESEEGRGKEIVISWTRLRDCTGMRAKEEEGYKGIIKQTSY